MFVDTGPPQTRTHVGSRDVNKITLERCPQNLIKVVWIISPMSQNGHLQELRESDVIIVGHRINYSILVLWEDEYGLTSHLPGSFTGAIEAVSYDYFASDIKTIYAYRDS